MSKPLTMTEAQEFDLRDKASRLHDWPTFGLATQRVVMNVLAEVDALRAALAAAEAKLADERKHADELARVIEKAIELCEEGTMPRSTLGVGVDLHAARRQEEAR